MHGKVPIPKAQRPTLYSGIKVTPTFNNFGKKLRGKKGVPIKPSTKKVISQTRALYKQEIIFIYSRLKK